MSAVPSSDELEAEVFGLRGADPRLGGPATTQEIEDEAALDDVSRLRELAKEPSILESTIAGSQTSDPRDVSISGAWAAEEKAREEKGIREREQATHTVERVADAPRQAAETVAETGAGIAEGASRTLGGAGRAIDDATDEVVAGVKRGALILGAFVLLAIAIFAASSSGSEAAVREAAR